METIIYIWGNLICLCLGLIVAALWCDYFNAAKQIKTATEMMQSLTHMGTVPAATAFTVADMGLDHDSSSEDEGPSTLTRNE